MKKIKLFIKNKKNIILYLLDGLWRFILAPVQLLRELTMSYEKVVKLSLDGKKYNWYGYKFNSRKFVALILLIVFIASCYIVIKEAYYVYNFVEKAFQYQDNYGKQKFVVIKQFLKLYKEGTPVTKVISWTTILSLGGLLMSAYGLYTYDKIKRNNNE